MSSGSTATQRKGERSEDKHTCTHPFRCSWKNEVSIRRPDSKENRLLKLLWGISHLCSMVSYVSHTSAFLSINRSRGTGQQEECQLLSPENLRWCGLQILADPGHYHQLLHCFIVREQIYSVA